MGEVDYTLHEEDDFPQAARAQRIYRGGADSAEDRVIAVIG